MTRRKTSLALALERTLKPVFERAWLSTQSAGPTPPVELEFVTYQPPPSDEFVEQVDRQLAELILGRGLARLLR